MTIFHISLLSISRHWLRKPLQFFFLIMGLSLATALWSSIQLLNSHAKNSYKDAVNLVTTSEVEILVSRQATKIPIKAFVDLRRAGWSVTPILTGELKSDKTITVLGIDPFTLSESKTFMNGLFEETKPFEKFFIDNKLGFASQETIKKLKRLPIDFNFATSNTLFSDLLVVDISIAEELLGEYGKITRLELTAPAPGDRAILKELELRLISSRTTGELEQLTESFHLNLTAFGFLGFVVGLFIVYSTLSLAFEQRRGTYMSLRSLGVPIRTVYAFTLTEIIVLALIGGIIGIFLGHFLATFLLPNVASTLNQIYGANLADKLILPKEEILIALLMPLLGTLLVSTNFLLKLHRLAPHNIRAQVIWNKVSNNNLKSLILVILLIVLIIFLAKSSLGLFKSFFIIALVILASSILLPLILKASLSFLIFLSKSKTPLLHWFLSDSYHQVNRVALSLNALMLAVAVTVGVDNMVKSFEDAFKGWLEKRLITEVYIRVHNEKQANQLKLALQNETWIENLYPIIDVKTKFRNESITIVGFKPADIYLKNWPLVKFSETTWPSVQSGNGILINEQFFYKHGLDLGAKVELESKLGPLEKISLPIMGIYPDYGNRSGQIMMDIITFQKYFSNDAPLNYAVKIMPTTSFESVSDMLREKYGLIQSEIINQSTIMEFSYQVFQRTFSITNALSGAMIIIAVLTLLTSLVTLSEIRLINLAPLWALGIKRFTLLKFELAQFLMLTFLTLLFAIPTGLLICHFLTSYLNVSAFGWKLPFVYYPKIWLETLLVASLASVIAIIFPTLLMFRNSPGLMIRKYKNDT